MHSGDLWPLTLSRPCMTIWWTSWLTAASTTRLRTSWRSWARRWSIRSTSSSWKISALSSNANRFSRFITKLCDASGSRGLMWWLDEDGGRTVFYLILCHVCAHRLQFRCHRRGLWVENVNETFMRNKTEWKYWADCSNLISV